MAALRNGYVPDEAWFLPLIARLRYKGAATLADVSAMHLPSTRHILAAALLLLSGALLAQTPPAQPGTAVERTRTQLTAGERNGLGKLDASGFAASPLMASAIGDLAMPLAELLADSA